MVRLYSQRQMWQEAISYAKASGRRDLVGQVTQQITESGAGGGMAAPAGNSA